MVTAVIGQTATQALASVLLQEPLHDVVRRLRGRGCSWREVAQAVANDTNGIIDLNRETYRLWYGADPDMAHSDG